MVKPRALHQSQLLTETAEDSGLSVATIKKALESYEKVAKDKIMDGYKVPLPGGIGYIYLVTTRSKEQKTHLELSDTHAVLIPKLRTIAAFSKPWRVFINADPRAPHLIKRLLERKSKEK